MQENIRTLHREQQAGQSVAIFEETIICDDLQWCVALLRKLNTHCREMAHFIAAFGRDFGVLISSSYLSLHDLYYETCIEMNMARGKGKIDKEITHRKLFLT